VHVVCCFVVLWLQLAGWSVISIYIRFEGVAHCRVRAAMHEVQQRQPWLGSSSGAAAAACAVSCPSTTGSFGAVFAWPTIFSGALLALGGQALHSSKR
jgi:hypothetical protein